MEIVSSKSWLKQADRALEITSGIRSPDFQNLNFSGFGFCMGYTNSGDLRIVQSNNGIVRITEFY